MSFPDSESVERAAEARDEVLLDDKPHHVDCPNARWHHPFKDAECECNRLFKEDKESAAEERADDEIKYGGM